MRGRGPAVVGRLAVAGIVVLVSLVSPPELAAEQTAGAARTGAPSPDVGAGPRPFDPLGIDEVKRAESIAPAFHDLSEALKGSRFGFSCSSATKRTRRTRRSIRTCAARI
jgi:hypothetical protein